ncbi:MAG: protein TolR [Chromatiales bacterium]
MARRRQLRKPMSEINVVPYIDVMLVLLIIFMITAPLLTQGVKVDLPQAAAEPLPPESEEPVVVSVTAAGDYYIDLGEDSDSPVDAETLQLRVAAVLRNSPRTPIMVRGDRAVDYGQVIDAMVLLQAAGAPSVGLVTRTPESEK